MTFTTPSSKFCQEAAGVTLTLLVQLPERSTVEAPVAAPEKEHARKNPVAVRRERLPENLPVVEEVIDPEPVKAQPEQWRCIGQEVSEQLDYEPGRFLRRRVVRRKYVHQSNPDFAPIIAPLPERLLDRSLPAPGLLAHIVVGKYCDHLPYTGRNRFTGNATGFICPGRV